VPAEVGYSRERPHQKKKPGTTEVGPTQILGQFLRDVARNNPSNFRVLSPDENASNRLTALYEVTKKAWLGEYFPEDADGGELAPDGRVMEMLSEHTLEGWLEGYLLTGRHGFLSSYEAFVHVSIRCSTSTPSGSKNPASCPGAPMSPRSTC
jgi:xylulose-5-phosphate/fructose-6-phosphate phosphoketolase